MILLRLQDVKLLPTGINRIVQDDGKIIRAARGDGKHAEARVRAAKSGLGHINNNCSIDNGKWRRIAST